MNNSYGKKGLFSKPKSALTSLSSLSSVKEIGGSYSVELEMPEYNRGEISVFIENHELVINAQRGVKSFEQRLILPRDASHDAVAKITDKKILKITIPKHPSKLKIKSIPVE
jgi:HSP20 family molecular chaperone IbpA